MPRPRRYSATDPPSPRKNKRTQDEDLKHPPKWEIVADMSPTYLHDGYITDGLNHPLAAGHDTPTTPIQALMEAAPGDEPERSLLEKQHQSETILDAVEALPVGDQEIVRALVFQRLSFREAADELGMDNHIQLFRRWAVIQDALRKLLGPTFNYPYEEEEGMK